MASGDRTGRQARGVTAAWARRLLLDLAGVEEGQHYGFPSFMVAGRFLARFRDDDEVLVIRLGSIADREVLMHLDPGSFFYTDHYRDYPAVLVRLAKVRRGHLAQVLEEARAHAASAGPVKRRTVRRARSRGPRR